ncbi:MAG: HIT family protein [Chloroflexi bacterium HGW-Chloroflexi-10]|nr:MAG: HIT family protein [Chloroflexi bacterium HGW-Chloroflexi-10]
MDNNCIFCQIMAGKVAASVVYEDEVCKAFMDIQPVTTGHVLVVPKQHAVGLADLPESTGGHLFQVGQRVAAALRASSLGVEGINFFLADGEVAFQTVFHLHLHVIPRYTDDGFGLKFGPNYRKLPQRSVLDETAEILRYSLR